MAFSAATGYVYKLELPKGSEAPFVFLVNDLKSRRELLRAEIPSSEVPEDGGFQWYRLGSDLKPGSRCSLGWLGTPLSVGLSDLEAFAGNRPLELWIRFKPGDGVPKTALIERVVAVKP